MICKAAEIILTLSATFIKAQLDQQSVDAKTDFAFLDMTTCFHNIHDSAWRTDSGNRARAQSISLIHCLFRLVKCKFTEPLYKSAWYTLLSLLIFSTYALSIKREGRNLTKKKKRKNIAVAAVVCIPLRLCSSIARYCDIAVIATALHVNNVFSISIETVKNTIKNFISKMYLLCISLWPMNHT